jgi:hypothetical protein
MRTTIDTYTGKPFRWNSICLIRTDDGKTTIVPERMTARDSRWLHPSRVRPALLADLNSDGGFARWRKTLREEEGK